jgi:excisionase family DNA binding protein
VTHIEGKMVKLTISTNDALSIAETCRKIGVSRRTIYRWINSGKLSTLSIAGKTLIPKSEVQRLRKEHRNV